MKAAVILSSYNGEKYIRQQIESILAQDCPIPFVLLVRDDGSTDATCTILQEYAAAGKLQWYSGSNLRSAKSFLDLLYHFPGYDFYAFADQDDYWKSNKLASGIEKLSTIDGPGLSFANARMVDADLNDLGRNVYKTNPYTDYETLTISGGLLGCTMVLNKVLADLIISAPVPEKLMMHDFYVAEVCAYHGGTIVYDSRALMLYRQHGKNVVGVSKTKKQAISSRMHAITHKEPVTVAEQAQSILHCYPNSATPCRQKWMVRIAGYRDSFCSAAALSLSAKTHYCTLNRGITMRLALLMRNR